MNDKNEKKGIGVVGAVILLVVFVALTIGYTIGRSDYMFSSNPKDVAEMIATGDKLSTGDYVSVTIDNKKAIVLDWYAETKHYINGFIPAGKERHCLVYMRSDANSVGEFISITVKGKKNFSKIEDLIDYANSEDLGNEMSEVKFEGEISSLNSEVLNYYKKSCDECIKVINDAYEYDFTGDIKVYEVTIDAASTKFGAYLMLAFCLLMVVVSVFLLKNAIKTKKNMASGDASTTTDDTSKDDVADTENQDVKDVTLEDNIPDESINNEDTNKDTNDDNANENNLDN